MNTVRVPLKTISDKLCLRETFITARIYKAALYRVLEGKVDDDVWASVTIHDHMCVISYYVRPHEQWRFDDTDPTGDETEVFRVDDMTINDVVKEITKRVNHRKPSRR